MAFALNSYFSPGRFRGSMMRLVSAIILLFATAALAASNSLKNLERTKVSGADYVRLNDWSESAGLRARWIKREEEIQVTNRWCKFSLTIDSIKAQINGVDVRLSLPVILKNNAALVSLVDVQNIFQPLLFPSKSAREKIETICLDPGHGGKDTGKIDKKNLEKKYTLLLAQEVSALLKAKNIKVILTRSRDEFVELRDRAEVANRNDADLFISLHYNSAESSDVCGVETYCLTPAGVESSNSGGGKSDKGTLQGNTQNDKNMLLAYVLHRAISRNAGLDDRGIKRARFEVLCTTQMPSVLIEGGFMTNPEEAKKIYEAGFRKKMAEAIVTGILEYKKIVER